MITFAEAKARAQAGRTDWNERTHITKATITWVDSEYEYELEIENDDRMDEEDFTAWVEENAEDWAIEDAAANGTTFEEIDHISYDTDYIDDDALFEREYDAYLEFEWECRTGR